MIAMREQDMIVAILGMAAVTYLVRFVPLLWCNRLVIPRVVTVWLRFVPLAIFAAMLAHVFLENNSSNVESRWPLLLSCLATIAITRAKRSFGWGMATGFGCYLALTFFSGRL